MFLRIFRFLIKNIWDAYRWNSVDSEISGRSGYKARYATPIFFSVQRIKVVLYINELVGSILKSTGGLYKMEILQRHFYLAITGTMGTIRTAARVGANIGNPFRSNRDGNIILNVL